VVKFVSDLRQVGGFVRVLRLTEHHDMAEILLNISVISWRSVLLVEETGVSGENHSKITRFSTKLEMRCYDVLLYLYMQELAAGRWFCPCTPVN
jgi:hypothetical protein